MSSVQEDFANLEEYILNLFYSILAKNQFKMLSVFHIFVLIYVLM